MKTNPTVKTALLALALLLAAVGPVLADDKKEPIEKYRAQAVSLDRGAASFLDIVITEWTTPEERQALIQTFLEGGSKALYDALEEKSEKGYVRAPGSLAYDMKYAWRWEIDGKHRIVLAADRPFGFLEMARSSRSTDYNVSLVVLDVDPKTGVGEGSAVGGVEFSIDEKTQRLNIEIPGTQPTRLTKVERRDVE